MNAPQRVFLQKEMVALKQVQKMYMLHLQLHTALPKKAMEIPKNQILNLKMVLLQQRVIKKSKKMRATRRRKRKAKNVE